MRSPIRRERNESGEGSRTVLDLGSQYRDAVYLESEKRVTCGIFGFSKTLHRDSHCFLHKNARMACFRNDDVSNSALYIPYRRNFTFTASVSVQPRPSPIFYILRNETLFFFLNIFHGVKLHFNFREKLLLHVCESCRERRVPLST